MAKMVVITSEGSVKQFDLANATTSIGRSDQSDVVVRGPLVSRIHAVVAVDRGAFYVRDAGSSNGTFVNGLKIRHQALRHQDVIRIGDCEIRFLDEGYSPARRRPLAFAAV